MEDDPIAQKLLNSRLKRIDIEAYLFDNAESALTFLLKSGADLIISDIALPEKTGIELLEILRNRREFDDVPVIIMTAYNDDSTHEFALQKGATRFIQKPIRQAVLEMHIGMALAWRWHGAQIASLTAFTKTTFSMR